MAATRSEATVKTVVEPADVAPVVAAAATVAEEDVDASCCCVDDVHEAEAVTVYVTPTCSVWAGNVRRVGSPLVAAWAARAATAGAHGGSIAQTTPIEGSDDNGVVKLVAAAASTASLHDGG